MDGLQLPTPDVPQRMQWTRGVQGRGMQLCSRVGRARLLRTTMPWQLLRARCMPQRHMLVQAGLWRRRLCAAHVPKLVLRQRLVPRWRMPVLPRIRWVGVRGECGTNGSGAGTGAMCSRLRERLPCPLPIDERRTLLPPLYIDVPA